MYFDKKVTIKRLSATQADADKENWQPVSGLQNIEANLQPASPEDVAITGGVFGKTYTMYTTHSGINDGDRVTISGLFTDGITLNKELEVGGVGNWSFQPLPHFEITCTEINE